MTTLQQAAALLPKLSSQELQQLIQRLFGEGKAEFPGIEKTPGVCGGRACIIRTRIPVWSLVKWKNMGVLDSNILEIYPSLRQQDLTNAWAYYRTHKAEIDFDIRENDEEAEQVEDLRQRKLRPAGGCHFEQPGARCFNNP